MSVLRQDGRILAIKMPKDNEEVPRDFYKLQDNDKFSVNLKEKPIIWAEDEENRRFHLIIT
jgi:hypothetical protein